MDTEQLLKEIESVFPFVEMPAGNDLVYHKGDCSECDNLRKDLEEHRGENITGDFIRLIHQELYSLSAQSYRWILPYYLRYCLTPEAQYNQMETEYLIYNLDPDRKNPEDTRQRLSLLNREQINCLINFLKWCLQQEQWQETYFENIDRAIKFLYSIRS